MLWSFPHFFLFMPQLLLRSVLVWYGDRVPFPNRGVRGCSFTFCANKVTHGLPGHSFLGRVRKQIRLRPCESILGLYPAPGAASEGGISFEAEPTEAAALLQMLWTLSCGMWDLVPQPGIKPGPPALGAQSFSHWTTKEIPEHKGFNWKVHGNKQIPLMTITEIVQGHVHGGAHV